MSTGNQKENAEPSATLAVSRPEPSMGASLGADETLAASQPVEEPIPSSALRRNITATQRLIEQVAKSIEKAHVRHDPPSALAALLTQKQSLINRKQALQALYENEMRKNQL